MIPEAAAETGHTLGVGGIGGQVAEFTGIVRVIVKLPASPAAVPLNVTEALRPDAAPDQRIGASRGGRAGENLQRGVA